MREGPVAALAQAVTVEDLEADPYPIYARLRREAPVCYIPAVGLWFVTRYDDVEFAASHPELFTAELDDSPVDRTFGSPTIITVDGERHLDLRRGLDSKYRPRQVNGYIDDLVRPIAEEVLDGLAGRDRAELMAGYFEPVSVLSLGTVLGIRDLGAARLRDWFWRLHQGVINFEGNPERERIGAECSREIDDALGPVFDRLEAAGDDSTISHLLRSGVPGGGCRARDFVMPTLKVILLGGMQEPGHGAGSTLVGLLSHPGQLAAVRDDPDRLLPAAVEEGLRWVAPIGTQTRQAVTDVDLGGATIPAGAPVGALVSSACRDESRFADPDRFDIFRPRQVNLAFGAGRHFCAGHAFSRAQIRIAIDVLLRRFPALALDPARPPVFRGWEFRAPRNLDVTW
ncbi:MAG TPA: cytochrome P450 [Streptosporangiaceae bacterium]|nr:cytochrome P450 [Streptosporangiaceae bacterium]